MKGGVSKNALLRAFSVPVIGASLTSPPLNTVANCWGSPQRFCQLVATRTRGMSDHSPKALPAEPENGKRTGESVHAPLDLDRRLETTQPLYRNRSTAYHTAFALTAPGHCHKTDPAHRQSAGLPGGWKSCGLPVRCGGGSHAACRSDGRVQPAPALSLLWAHLDCNRHPPPSHPAIELLGGHGMRQ
jgi:hypothetical protein